MRVERFLWEAADRFPEKTAIVCGDARPSYRELADRAAGLARELKRRGLRRGERVVLFLHNSPEAVAGVFGVIAAGGVFSVVNPGTKADKARRAGVAIIDERRFLRLLRGGSA